MSPKARKALKELGIPIRKPRVEKGKEKSNYEPPHIEELPESRTRTASPAPQPTNNQAGGPRQSAKKLSHRVENTGTGSASAQVCLAISPDHQLLTRGPKRPPFPARDPKSVPTALSQPVPARTHSQTVTPSACLHAKCLHPGTFSYVLLQGV
jgi:hypothetical protein